ncbi:serine hydrolase domain-containing protein [Antrihabitans spumae]|uniref:Serine hydrolase domain-containing protein n=1 Tax=Antrihabitans spumae TaxID=3373370 RepID=A0ABW7JHK3_9NOCA
MRYRTRTVASIAAAALLIVTGCSSSDDSSETTSSGTSPSPSPFPFPSTSTPADPGYAAEVKSAVEKVMKDNAIPGAIVVIKSAKQGDSTATFGTQKVGEDVPMSVDDYFRIGSITKTMTSTVILQLVQEGKLSLDDPIDKYRKGVPNGENITIAQLSEMRSGLFTYTADPGFDATLNNDPEKAWTPDELLDIAFSHPNVSAPGEKYEYVNTNIILLGLVIEQLTGKSIEQAFTERIFEPLGLKHTSFPAATDTSIPDPHPQGYSFPSDENEMSAADQKAAVDGKLKPADQTNWNPSWGWTAGGAISTVGDLTTYIEAVVKGGLLDEKMQKIRLDSILPIDPRAGYGLGIARFGSLLGHDGQIPGFMTFAGYDPTSELTIVIATNLATVPAGEGTALAVLKGIMPIFYGPDGEPADPARLTPPR